MPRSSGYWHLCLEHLAYVGIAQVGVTDDGVGVSGAVGLGLHPRHLVDGPCGRPVGLHIDRLRNTAALDVAQIFLDGIVPPDRLIGAEDARQHRPLEPRQVLPAPDVVVGVDDPVHSGPHGGPRRSPAPGRDDARPSHGAFHRGEREAIVGQVDGFVGQT